MGLNILPYKISTLAKCFIRNSLKKVIVKYKSPSNETQPKASLPLDQLIPSSSLCLYHGDRANTTPSPEPEKFNIYTYCHFQVMLYLLALLQKRGRKLYTIKTCELSLVGDDKIFSLRSHQSQIVIIIIIRAAII